MKQILLIAVSMLLLSGCSSIKSAPPAEINNIIPQAVPVAALFAAVQNNDIEGIKSVCTEKFRLSVQDDEKWNEILNQLKCESVRLYGDDFDPEGFEYTYEGSETVGRVSFIYRNGRSEPTDVIKENGEWKLN